MILPDMLRLGPGGGEIRTYAGYLRNVEPYREWENIPDDQLPPFVHINNGYTSVSRGALVKRRNRCRRWAVMNLPHPAESSVPLS